MTDAERQARKVKAQLLDLTKKVLNFENAMDQIMKCPSTPERGANIARAMNFLSSANQSAMMYGLGYSMTKTMNLYKKGKP